MQTPYFTYDLDQLLEITTKICSICQSAGIRVLFPLKTCSLSFVLKHIQHIVDGFEVSSLFEARLAYSILKGHKPIHFTSPGIREHEIPELTMYCDKISCNSFRQLQLFKNYFTKEQIGLRVNPQLSFVNDERYDPCCRYSKLGIDIYLLVKKINTDPSLLQLFSGITFHSVCESPSFQPLLKTSQHIKQHLSYVLENCTWCSFGGGYLFEQDCEYLELAAKEISIAQVFVEPGSAIVNQCAQLHTTILDIFSNEDKYVVVVDTTVNHIPEVLEFGEQPSLEQSTQGEFAYIITGCSCLSGDIFGTYKFSHSLKIGDTLTFKNCGAYSVVKNHMFNGINLPSIYSKQKKCLMLQKQFSYEDFLYRF